jgi:hypothetical protein
MALRAESPGVMLNFSRSLAFRRDLEQGSSRFRLSPLRHQEKQMRRSSMDFIVQPNVSVVC